MSHISTVPVILSVSGAWYEADQYSVSATSRLTLMLLRLVQVNNIFHVLRVVEIKRSMRFWGILRRRV